MQRRQFLSSVAGAALASLFTRQAVALNPNGVSSLETIHERWRKLLPAGRELSLSTEPLTVPKRHWRQELAPEAYDVLFEEATERPFISPLNKEKRTGLYVCAACRLPLFSSEMKFDSGTGWPSFFTHIPEHLATKLDFKLIIPRTEYHCVRCGGHQGHLFKDGPKPTGERWCNNGIALAFLPAEDAE